MKKSLKGFLALFLAAVLALGAAPLAGVASLHLSLPLRGLFTVRSSAATSGSCGSNATFTISGGTLTVSGTGNIDDYYGEVDPPWYGETFTRVVVQSGITGIGAYAFYDNGNLTGVTLPNTVTAIGNGAFCYCPSLTSFTVPDSVTEVGTGVFAEDHALVSVHIGAGLNDEDTDFDYFFDGAYALASVTAAAGHPTLYTENGILYNKAKTALIFCPEAKTGAVTMPATVVTVFDYACEYCAQITGITFSNALKYIGEYAFCGCDSLTNLNIPDSVTAIGDYAFEYCIDLTTASIGSGLETFNNTMFDGCGNMTAVNFSAANPNYASHDGAVYDKGKTTLLLCPIGKTAVVFPATVTAIGERAFANCAELTSISLPNSVQSVEDEAFNYCEKLQTVAFGTGLADLGYDVFFFCNELKSISVAAGNTSFKAESGVLFNFAKTVLLAYPQNKAGTSYAVPSTVKTIGDNAFQQNANLTTVSFPAGLTRIGDYAFYWSEVFKNFAVPEGLLDIGYDAFYGTYWHDHLPEGQVAYAGKVAYEYIVSRAYDYEMPEGYVLTFKADTTAVAAGAFADETNLAGVTFPASMTWIGADAFYACESLKQVAVPKTVKTIGDYAFGNCTLLVSAVIPAQVTAIDPDAFYKCPGLTISGYAGSAAQVFAQQPGHAFAGAQPAGVQLESLAGSLAATGKLSLELQQALAQTGLKSLEYGVLHPQHEHQQTDEFLLQPQQQADGEQGHRHELDGQRDEFILFILRLQHGPFTGAGICNVHGRISRSWFLIRRLWLCLHGCPCHGDRAPSDPGIAIPHAADRRPAPAQCDPGQQPDHHQPDRRYRQRQGGIHGERRNQPGRDCIAARADEHLQGRGHAPARRMQIEHQQGDRRHHQGPTEGIYRHRKHGPPRLGGEQAVGDQIDDGSTSHDDKADPDLLARRHPAREAPAEPGTGHDAADIEHEEPEELRRRQAQVFAQKCRCSQHVDEIAIEGHARCQCQQQKARVQPQLPIPAQQIANPERLALTHM